MTKGSIHKCVHLLNICIRKHKLQQIFHTTFSMAFTNTCHTLKNQSYTMSLTTAQKLTNNLTVTQSTLKLFSRRQHAIYTQNSIKINMPYTIAQFCVLICSHIHKKMLKTYSVNAMSVKIGAQHLTTDFQHNTKASD